MHFEQKNGNVYTFERRLELWGLSRIYASVSGTYTHMAEGATYTEGKHRGAEDVGVEEGDFSSRHLKFKIRVRDPTEEAVDSWTLGPRTQKRIGNGDKYLGTIAYNWCLNHWD